MTTDFFRYTNIFKNCSEIQNLHRNFEFQDNLTKISRCIWVKKICWSDKEQPVVAPFSHPFFFHSEVSISSFNPSLFQFFSFFSLFLFFGTMSVLVNFCPIYSEMFNKEFAFKGVTDLKACLNYLYHRARSSLAIKTENAVKLK